MEKGFVKNIVYQNANGKTLIVKKNNAEVEIILEGAAPFLLTEELWLDLRQSITHLFPNAENFPMSESFPANSTSDASSFLENKIPSEKAEGIDPFEDLYLND